MDYKLIQAVKVLSSHNLAQSVVDVLKDLGYSKPFVVIDNFLLESAYVKEMFQAFDDQAITYEIFSEVLPDPPYEQVNKGAELAKDCDAILAIGGGSVIDTARGINIVRKNGGSILDYAYNRQLEEFCNGLIAIPTTSGTGSELSNALVVTDTDKKEKIAILENQAVSEVAILIPELTVSMPKQLTIATGLDAFSHAAEAYTSVSSSPVVDAICEKIMFLIYNYLPLAAEDGSNLEARERMAVAAALGGWVINNGGTQIGHSQAHILGPKLNIAHGRACAYALPGTLKETANVKAKKIKEIGYILDASFPEQVTDQEIGQIVADRFREFRDDILGLQPLEVDSEEILTYVDDVKNERFASNAPFEVTDEAVRRVLKEFG